MTDSVVHYRLEGEIGVITINYPPVNALGQGVREGLLACLAQGEADGAAKALVVMAEGRTFPAGADIREFGKPPAGPALPDVIAAYERSEKVIIAAIHGTALGGGLEVALGCDYRVALASAQVGLPEVKLGLLPGAGGTQRLPRLIGAEQALPLIVNGNPVKAPAALKLGILDAVLDGDLLQGALEFARAKVAENASRRPLCDASVAAVSDTLFSDFEQSIAHRQRGFKAPFACIEAVKAAAELPFAQGLEKERELFLGLMASTESKAQRHVFFAEREVAKVPGLDAKTTQREVRSVGIIGAGTMGGGIAMNFLNAGIPVTLLEVKEEFLSRGVAVIRANYEATAKKGRLTSEQVEQRMALLTPSLSYDDLAQVDVVIEAVFENMDIKKSVFQTLDKVCKPGAILATNTSTLDVNEIANVTQRPQDVIGLHFFSPANVMKLLEIVRGEATADDVIATTMALARRIGKVGVLVGVCHGFVGNRMLHRRQAEAMALVKQGASPQAVDKVLFDLGFPMGPFATSDLAGLDVGYRIREEIRKDDPSKAPRTWMDDLVEKGRCGQKTQAGVFDYEKGNRTPVPSADVDAIIAAYRVTEGVTPRAVSEDEILERCMYVMVNEGAKILEEGIAMRALDIDVIWIYGYGFPVYRGGVMFWADTVGLDKIYARICELYQQTGEEHWRPSAYLKELVDAGRGFHH